MAQMEILLGSRRRVARAGHDARMTPGARRTMGANCLPCNTSIHRRHSRAGGNLAESPLSLVFAVILIGPGLRRDDELWVRSVRVGTLALVLLKSKHYEAVFGKLFKSNDVIFGFVPPRSGINPGPTPIVIPAQAGT